MQITCPTNLIRNTLEHLQNAGVLQCECVVLWLGRRNGDSVVVEEAYVPLQRAKQDMFHIPPEGMTALQDKLRYQRLMVAAQIHSHPYEAFHSEADDRWAIIRHENALSLVVPYFAKDVSVANFLNKTKIYRFSEGAEWLEEIQFGGKVSCFKIV